MELSRKKRVIFAAITIFFSLCAMVFVSELILRYRRHFIEKSDHLEKGLILYDKHLGWRLAPNWKGTHKHYDFDAVYSTNRYGFRGGFEIGGGRSGRRLAFVGDSFTFCFGVNNNETFIEVLNSKQPRDIKCLNFGVPGYSTDQECLLLEEQVFSFAPDVVLLVVYLANDLLDNELPFPLQADHGKPYFELTHKGLELRNVPVPMETKPVNKSRLDLTRAVLGEDARTETFMARFLDRSELFRLLRPSLYKTQDLSHRFDERFEHALGLFNAIVDRIRAACTLRKIKLCLILMPGKSFVEQPGSASAQFQDYLRKKIVENGERMKVEVIDLATLLRESYQRETGEWFYPNEGHLTAKGNRVVADILAPIILLMGGKEN